MNAMSDSNGVEKKGVEPMSSESGVKQFDALISALGEDARVSIFTHKTPDPDGIASACAIQWLLKKKYHLDSTIYYDGEVSHKQSQTMLNVLELTLERAETWSPEEEDFIIIVDATPKNVSTVNEANVVIDHHRVTEIEGDMVWLKPVGAASTLVYELIEELELSFDDDMDVRIATALFLGIRVDTSDLTSETATDRDYKASFGLSNSIDRGKLAKIVRYPLPKYYFDLERVLNQEGNSVASDSYFIGTLDIISPTKKDALPMLADKMVRLEGIETAIVFAVVGDCVEASIRSQNSSLDVNSFAKKVFGKDNAGGKMGQGGACVALGLFDYEDLTDELRQELWEAQKKVLFKRIIHVASGNG
jgi:nanoRNase/pAp phosphatase (c-di-AMP/oligoRNAs hydrolase)